ncbi:DNA mismatch repair endonuclease MutL [Desertibacillus haloalkaliphilus]|uniref:DNA mismatch repair endonuclease MutL n=1 Tax=Desertibacillus haloalkaliphilus TaxID=1328930 RepID=UPI001C2653F9|nr:DNA mismatch repair endonuclease MutL [Desertibacillus haloalkaliphilus]MBU8907377.1 DNA mismatch repair endonuclease MutL [Desertibacillus haloalkaliphilus]
MGKIVQLDEHLSNKIAAGEVVERPASIVKELVENAIDANSTRVTIEVEEGGLSKIRVLDNGDGIENGDCHTAFFRHATSKIKTDHDLFRIVTLGFRGEALPSIASVSHLEMKTSIGEGPGTHLILEGGKVVEEKSTSSRKGTEITVTNLFYNTPARLKYMKTIHTELGNITDIVNRLAMAHPELSFHLTHNGKDILRTNGNGELLQVIAAIYGRSVAKQMLPVSFESLDFTVKGYIAKPEVTRASRQYMSTFMNGRFVKNYPLSRAIHEGYHTLLPIGRHPIVVLTIQMDPLLIDVNVHPSKLEVRLSKEQELMELVSSGIKDTFQTVQLIPEVKRSAPQRVQSEQVKLDLSTFEQDHREKREPETVREVASTFPKEEVRPNLNEPITEEPVKTAQAIVEVEDEGDDEEVFTPEESIAVSEPTFNEQITSVEAENRVPVLYPIGQMHGTYILAQNDEGLYIVDQHAAQERIKYEYFREKVAEPTPEAQELLVPMTLEYTQAETVIIEEHLQKLAQVGVFLESFGSQAYIVRSHPTWFPKGLEAETLKEIIDQVIERKKIDIKKLREEAAILMSCKAAIKANRHLRHDEIFTLLESLRKSSDPFTCPHGRPIIVHLTTYEMEKMFKRIM